ncbi:MAG: nucleotide exchange factor GrpE [Alphaproteobacteria bacterium]
MSDERAQNPETGPDAEPKAQPGAVNPNQSPEEQIAELRDKLLRAMADAENTRRRAEKDKQEASKFGMTKFARDLLSVSDNLRRALETISQEERDNASDMVKNLLTGVEMTEKELLACFQRYGIRRVDSRGEKFDPNKHQAVAEVPGTGQPNGTVVEVFQVGYVMEDRLLRPAMVTVAKDVDAPADAGGEPPAAGAGPEGSGGQAEAAPAQPEAPQPGGSVNTTA